ncbi:hypothetical protein EVA_07813 [gut metagenome]|uniref:Uncharacterized protein n=1 Tax=gut metagenome TaxID=749906 RepID=J9GB73_9ZZZZ
MDSLALYGSSVCFSLMRCGFSLRSRASSDCTQWIPFLFSGLLPSIWMCTNFSPKKSLTQSNAMAMPTATSRIRNNFTISFSTGK